LSFSDTGVPDTHDSVEDKTPDFDDGHSNAMELGESDVVKSR
jgi:hypothetical protein